MKKMDQVNENCGNANTTDASSDTLDNVLSKIGFGKFNYVVIALAGITLACVFLETVTINVILPLAQCDLDMTTQDKSILSSIGFVGIILSSHLWGFLADTRGRKKVIVPTLFIASFLSLVSSIATSFWLLLLLRFLNGVFISGPSATVYAYVGEFHSVEMRSRALMYVSAVLGLACYWYPGTASWILNQEWSHYFAALDITLKPWRLFIIIATLPTIVCAICLLIFVPESPKYTFAQGDEAETLSILQLAYRKNKGNSFHLKIKSLTKDDEFGVGLKERNQNVFEFMWNQTKPLFQHPHLKNTLRACFIQFSIFSSTNGFWTFFPEIANGIGIWRYDGDQPATICEIYNATRSLQVNSNVSLASNQCLTKLEPSTFINILVEHTIYAVGWIILAVIINKIGKLIAINSIFTICTISAITLIFSKSSLLSNISYVTVMAVGLTITVVSASTAELCPTQYRAMALCLSLMVGRLGGVCGSLFIGFLMDHYCTYIFLMPAVLLAISACLTFTIPNIGNID
ncbi:synaptic vesicle glycoprotein 2C-like [Bradysia coprophila]|uniref:synaptic vesicle glycoprotein 2C-like n=1 Tax=Bradysia coprophila TaxID=38358 RepID=UPI00187DCB50|nr:synaptic vesicle glycoprotein 2C-like [Bradysia coprophila]